MPGRRGRPPHPDVLTPAEWAVLDGLRHGMSRRQVAERRGVSGYAVRYHARNIARKIGVAGVRELRYWPGVPAASAITSRNRKEHMVQAPKQEQQARPAAPGPLGQVSLLARDIGRAEEFYRDRLGLAHLFTFGDLAFFACGATRLFLRQAADEWHPGSVLYFTVTDIHASYQDLAGQGVGFHGAPHLIHRHDDGTEEWMAFFADTEGNTLALMSQVTPAGPAGTAPASTPRHATLSVPSPPLPGAELDNLGAAIPHGGRLRQPLILSARSPNGSSESCTPAG